MTDRELAGCALLPCNFPCEKCGSQDIVRAFRPEGEKWRVEVYGRAASKYAYADAYVATSSCDHINHRCRCCQYEWQTLPMKKQRRNRRTPSSEGDGRDGERLDWLCAVAPARRVEGGMGFRAYEDVAPLDVEHSHWVALTDRFYGTAREAIDAAIAAAEGERAKE